MDLVGQTIGKYKILKKLGEGGFGAVFQAEHTLMKRLCAIKTLHKSMEVNDRVAARFKREGQVASRFKHANAIEVYDFDRLPDGMYYIAMEYLTGESLRDRLKREKRPPLQTILEITLQVLAALNAAHRGGVIHRDLKPENIYLEPRDDCPHFVKVLDFGIAKLKEISKGGESDIPTAAATKQGDFFGTPSYASPEQCMGAAVDGRADLYSVGVLLFEMLAGRLPFQATTAHGFMAQHLFTAAPTLEAAGAEYHEVVESLVAKAIAKNPAERFQTAAEMIEAIQNLAVEEEVPLDSGIRAGARTPSAGTLRGLELGSRALPRAVLVTLILCVLAGGTAGVALFGPWSKNPVEPSDGPGPSTAQAMEQEARPKLDALRRTRGEGTLGRERLLAELEGLQSRYLGTPSARDAALEIEDLKKEIEKAAEMELAAVKSDVDALVSRGDYGGALERMASVPTAFAQTSYSERWSVLRSEVQRLKTSHATPDQAAKELADAEALAVASPRAFSVLIAKFDAIARRFAGQESAGRAAQRAAALRTELEEAAGKEWATRSAQVGELVDAGKFDEALERCSSFPSDLGPSKGRQAASNAAEELAHQVQRLETSARTEHEQHREKGKMQAAARALEPFAVLRSPAFAAVRTDAEMALASLAKVAPLHEGMVLVQAGSYSIGSDASRANERPAHAVSLSPFFIDRCEVSNAEYAAFLDEAAQALTPPVAAPANWPEARPPAGGERLPVVAISQADAAAFCRWAGKRLPTEEEWEAAARGRTATAFPWGAERWDPGAEPRRALIGRTAGDRKEPVAVDLREFGDVTPLGVRGLAGNVSEWTSSVFRIYPGHKNPPSLEKEPGQGTYGVVRGGNFTMPVPAPATYRYAMPRDESTRFVGFRAAKDGP